MRTRANSCAVVLIFGLTLIFPAVRQKAEPNSKDSAMTEVQKGKQVYDQKCAICHYSASTEKKIGPGLEGLMKREKFKNGMKADDENLRRVIERGGKNMPGSALKSEQLRNLIAYVKTL